MFIRRKRWKKNTNQTRKEGEEGGNGPKDSFFEDSVFFNGFFFVTRNLLPSGRSAIAFLFVVGVLLLLLVLLLVLDVVVAVVVVSSW